MKLSGLLGLIVVEYHQGTIYPDFNSCLLLICMKIFHICRFIFNCCKHRTRISSAFLRLFWASCYIPHVFKFESLSLYLSLSTQQKKDLMTNAKLSTNWSRQNMNPSSWFASSCHRWFHSLKNHWSQLA